MKNTSNWKIFFILLCASVIGVLAVLPYVFTLQQTLLEQSPIALPLLVIIQIMQSVLLFSIAIGVGLELRKRIGFSLPLLEALNNKKDIRHTFLHLVRPALIGGTLAGGGIVVLDYIFVKLGVSVGASTQTVPLWQRLLVPLYGGINEEILLRLFLMTFLVWVSFKFKQTEKHFPTEIGIWIAIFVTAIIFGLGHLPITATLTQITPIIIVRAIVLNGIGGIIFGWLYWKKGFEAAVIAHAIADIYIQLIFPILLGITL